LAHPSGAPRRLRGRRAGIFADYRLRIAAVARDYGMTERAQAPEDSRAVHDEKAAL
jgi:hypothetical protein